MRKIQLHISGLQQAVKFLSEKHEEITVSKTGYSASIKTPDGRNYLFTEKTPSRSLFSVANRIKRDVKASNIHIDHVNRKSIHYHSFKKRLFPKECYCIDLNSAYPSVLLRDGFITADTYKKMHKVPKIDRLKSTGMLATQKAIFHIKKNKVVKTELIKSEFSEVFFYLCKEVGDVLMGASILWPHEFLFFWVDGIFVDTLDPQKFVDFFNEKGLNSKIEKVEKMRFTDNQSYLLFEKEGERKIMSVPRPKLVTDESIINWLNQ